jgi:hypothetical protein
MPIVIHGLNDCSLIPLIISIVSYYDKLFCADHITLFSVVTDLYFLPIILEDRLCIYYLRPVMRLEYIKTGGWHQEPSKLSLLGEMKQPRGCLYHACPNLRTCQSRSRE